MQLNHSRPPTHGQESELLANWGFHCGEGARTLGQCSLALPILLQWNNHSVWLHFPPFNDQRGAFAFQRSARAFWLWNRKQGCFD